MPNPEELEKLQAVTEELKPTDAPPEMIDKLKTKIASALAEEKEDRKRGAVNDKPWDDLDVTQKIERLREIVKEIQRSVQWSYERFRRIESRLDDLQEHSHVDSKVVIPVVSHHRDRGYGEQARADKVAGWF